VKHRVFNKWVYTLSIAALAGTILSGCGGQSADQSKPGAEGGDTAKQEQNTPPPKAITEPITLKIYSGTTLTDEDFKAFMVEPLKKKFPTVTLTLTQRGDDPREQVAVTKDYPDLIYDSGTMYWNAKGLNLLEPLDIYIKKYKFDMNRLISNKPDPETKHWESLPLFGNFDINWLNKDIFDKFGVPYPLGLITWDQVNDLNRKLVGVRDGRQYIGMYPDYHFMGQGLQLAYIDPKTNKATVNNDSWKKILNVVKTATETPGFIQGKKYEYRRNEWLKDQNVAMVIATGNQMVGPLSDLYNKGTPMNWDMGAFPNFKEKLGVAPEAGNSKIMLTNTSKYKDEAFQVMAYLESDEVQTIMAMRGKLPTIANPQVQEKFGEGIDSLKGKNVKAIFAAKPAEDVELTDYNSTIGKKVMGDYVQEIVVNNMDINTALRKADEEINNQMAAVLNGTSPNK
jgi:multiple sugar transport system substrate-binding protein